MSKTLPSLVVAIGFAAWVGTLHAEPAPRLPKGWKFRLPAGNAAAGEIAVRQMQCYQCHRIPTGNFPEARSRGGVGPDLVPAYSKLPREFLAEAIIGEHTYMAGRLEHFRAHREVSAKMRDYTGIMTVRQLLDIVEYLKHLGNKPARKP
jgi:Cytochrome c